MIAPITKLVSVTAQGGSQLLSHAVQALARLTKKSRMKLMESLPFQRFFAPGVKKTPEQNRHEEEHLDQRIEP